MHRPPELGIHGRPRLLVCVAERSGDQLAAKVVNAARERIHGVQVWGLAGSCLRGEGVYSFFDTEQLGGVGVTEVLPSIGRAMQAQGALRKAIAAWRPDVVLTVDSPSLMMRFARIARQARTPVVHCVAPQVWAWRPGRASIIADSVDRLLCLFPHEPEIFRRHGCDAHWVGHPAASEYEPRRWNAVRSVPVYGLAPGSRTSEVQRLWPSFISIAQQIRRKQPGAEFVLALAPGMERSSFTGIPGLKMMGFDALKSCDSVLCCSGTATLELGLLGVPQVVVYKLSRASYLLARALLSPGQSASLPNILLDDRLVPEYLQEIPAEAIAKSLMGARLEQEASCEVARRLAARLDNGDAVSNIVDSVEPWLAGERQLL